MTDLAAAGVHRDPSAHDPIAGATLTQRMVRVASSFLGRSTSRRSFLTRTAVVGSALAVAPIDFLTKPGSAYAYTCGTCGDGWTAFCCTINGGSNSCPPNSFVGGWWKADNAAYCCGAARYIIDCNASCPTRCSCRCAGGSCDGRRTCCNQFRYGQCHQEIACYGPVVCRVATCTPAWRYDPSCTSSSATDNKTVNHGAPCLSQDCGSPIDKKYKELGGSGGFLGPVVQREQAIGSGRYARYRGGNIYWSSPTGAHEVHGDILTEYLARSSVSGELRFPVSDTLTSPDGGARYSDFQNGRIYYVRSTGASYTLPGPILLKHVATGGLTGLLGYPTAPLTLTPGKTARYVSFRHGRIYQRQSAAAEVHGAVFTKHQEYGGVSGIIGYPVTDLVPVGDGIGKVQWFERGHIFYRSGIGAAEVHGAIKDRYVSNGYCQGHLGYPTADTIGVADGIGKYSPFQHGRIYFTSATGAHEVSGKVLDAYLATYGGPAGQLGYPTGELTPDGSLQRQQFEHGRLTYDPATGIVTLG
ncbi:MAG: hypothetical protein JWM05_3322 [Acidimicrobiales bacterium]|nr:hypothetical protein [Acidimicrobiales bacterium]